MSETTTTATTATTVSAVLISADAYAALDKAGKAAARKAVDDAMKAAIRSGDLTGAQECDAWLVSMKSTKAAPAPVDYRQLVADRIATMRAAANLLEFGDERPETMPEDVDLSDLPEGVADLDAARAMASAKISRRTTKEVIQGVVDEAFAELPVGTFLTLAQVGVQGGHPRGSGASGAIAARVDWDDMTTTLEGVEPVERTATAPRGLRSI